MKNVYSYMEIESEFGIKKITALQRFRMMNIKGVLGTGNKHYFTFEEVNLVLFRPHQSKRKIKHDISVIECFLSHRNNTVKEIAMSLAVPVTYVDTCLESFFIDKCVIVESKLNNPDFVL